MDEEILDYNEQKEGWVSKMVDWQKKHISDRQMTLILAFIIGLLASVAGYFLHGIVHEIQLLLTSGFNKGTYNLLFLLFPIVGIYLTMLFIKYVVRDNISHGITRVLYAISTKNSKLKAKKTMILLVGCGASAAIAGIFKAPIAGLVFTLEVLMVDLSMASLLPILISCVTATCFTYILMGSKSLFDFTLTSPWALDRVPACLLLGIFCGLVSLYFMRTMSVCEGFFAKLSPYPYVKLLFGGLILSSLIFLFPSLYGEGYSAVNVLLKGQNVEDWGQVMSRSLFYGHNQLLILYLIAELTGGYQLFMPLMIVCISSLLTISIFESHSIYALRLAREGKLLTHHIDKAALTLLGMQDVIEKDYHPVGPDLPMSKLVSEISRSNNNFLPVLDQAGVLLGVIDITKIRHIIFRTELYQHFTVRQLMMQPSAVLTEHDSMDEVMQKFDKTDTAQLPVVDVAGVLKGYISRTRIYSMYRQIVADMSAE